ncbi:O-antigen ligase family protein [Terasakiella sp. SH-1]|uniref:O-antigen ligase family protein n=1 Tax=Terasakiella sp. SH-1 TaxID=2560057 RepID=UPI0010731FB3|nr:O-antigen ligase family protein [Terasakiella sp. SH-1]
MTLPRLHRRFTQLLCALIGCLIIWGAWLVLPHPVLVVALALVPVVGFIALKFPFLMVLGFVIFSFFRIHEVFPQLYPLRIPQLLAMGTLASLAFNFTTQRIKIYWRDELSVFMIFFSLVTIGVFLATNRSEAMGSWSGTYVKIMIMVFAIAWLSQSIRSFAILIYSMLGAGVVVGAVTLSNKIKGIGLVEGTRVTIGRDIGSMLGDPNDLALVLLFPASFALALIFTPKSGWLAKLCGILCFITVLSAIIATQSRGGLLGITAVMSVFGYRKIKNKALFFSLGGIALVCLFILAGVSDRASGGAHEEGIDESAMGRIHAWNAAIGMALHHPLTGVGINNFLSNYYMYSDFWDGKNHAVHSTWFGVLAETGLLGLLIFLGLIFLLLRNGLNTMNRLQNHPSPIANAMAQAVFAGLIGFCTSGTFLTMGFTWPVYILLSLSVAISHFAQSHSPIASQNATTPTTQKHNTLK